jgi:hypothetical protein
MIRSNLPVPNALCPKAMIAINVSPSCFWHGCGTGDELA